MELTAHEQKQGVTLGLPVYMFHKKIVFINLLYIFYYRRVDFSEFQRLSLLQPSRFLEFGRLLDSEKLCTVYL